MLHGLIKFLKNENLALKELRLQPGRTTYKSNVLYSIHCIVFDNWKHATDEKNGMVDFKETSLVKFLCTQRVFFSSFLELTYIEDAILIQCQIYTEHDQRTTYTGEKLNFP